MSDIDLWNYDTLIIRPDFRDPTVNWQNFLAVVLHVIKSDEKYQHIS